MNEMRLILSDSLETEIENYVADFGKRFAHKSFEDRMKEYDGK